MSYQHTISIVENPTSLLAPLTADSAIQVVVGAAPINLAGDPQRAVGRPILTNSFDEAKQNLGYSDDFKQYPACEAMDVSYRVFNVAPVIFINVLDPAKHKEEKTSQLTLQKGEAVLADDAIMLGTLRLSNGATTYEAGKDYTAEFNDAGKVMIKRIDKGAMQENAALSAVYDVLKPEMVSANDILSGIGLIDEIYPRLGVVPGILLAPGWTDKVNIGLALLAKTVKLNGNFSLMAYLDADCQEVKEYSEVGAWKANNYVDANGFVLWPQALIGEKQYHMSVLAAARTAQTDAANEGVPFVSPSNQLLKITGTVLADGTEVYLDTTQAGLLNSQGVATAINASGWKLWGNNTSIYPASTDVKDRFLPVRRMFSWQGNTFILTYFQKVDSPMNRKLIDAICDSENIRLNGLKKRFQIADARIEYLADLNPLTSLLDGKITFKQYFTPFPPAEGITNILEYDPSALQASLEG